MYFSSSGQIRGCREKGKVYPAFPSTYMYIHVHTYISSFIPLLRMYLKRGGFPGLNCQVLGIENTVAKLGKHTSSIRVNNIKSQGIIMPVDFFQQNYVHNCVAAAVLLSVLSSLGEFVQNLPFFSVGMTNIRSAFFNMSEACRMKFCFISCPQL